MGMCIISPTAVQDLRLDWNFGLTCAQLFAFGLSFSICYGVKYGLGRHMATISAYDQDRLARLEYAFSVLYVGLAAPCMSHRHDTILIHTEPSAHGHQDKHRHLLQHSQ